MIHRPNYRDVKRYLRYLAEVKLNSQKTVRKRWGQLRHLLEWADDKALTRAAAIRPAFPQYLLTARNDGRDEQLSPEAIKATCGTARRFFVWARMEHPRRYRGVGVVWIDTLTAPRVTGGEPSTREVFDLASVRRILELRPETLTERRDQAAIAFLFLSGMRVGAFVTAPINAIDLGERSVKQWPSLGVQTKNGKAATTYLLDIPDLLHTVGGWDSLVWASLPPTDLWYAALTTDGMDFLGGGKRTVTRRNFLARGIRRLCNAAGIPYLPPHSLRHGHAVYALKKAKTVADLKAVSQNLMHSSLVVTDGIYGVLTKKDVSQRIASLNDNGIGEPDDRLTRLEGKVDALLAQMHPKA